MRIRSALSRVGDRGADRVSPQQESGSSLGGRPRSIKLLMTNRLGIWEVGNGFLEDILFRVNLHPGRKCVAVTESE